ncbi:MAG: class I SAM-dependent methyltransferase [Acidobacteria bacterium]|nr:class I SAM-dependent methyltransferase [Acidobacteriota bacterium]
MSSGIKLRLVLPAAGAVFVLAAIADYHLANRGHPIMRPAGVEKRASAAEYHYGDESFDYAWDLERDRRLLPVVGEYLKPLPPSSSLLDLGCGTGRFLSNLRGRGWKLTGVDFSDSGVKLARTRYPEIRFETGDVTQDLSRLGYGSYDAVIGIEIVEHLFLPRKFAANALQLLKPGGILVISTPYFGPLKNLAIGFQNRWDQIWDPLWDFGHIKFWSVGTLSQLLFESGFEQLEWRGAGRYPHLWKNLVLRARKPQGKAGSYPPSTSR